MASVRDPEDNKFLLQLTRVNQENLEQSIILGERTWLGGKTITFGFGSRNANDTRNGGNNM